MEINIKDTQGNVVVRFSRFGRDDDAYTFHAEAILPCCKCVTTCRITNGDVDYMLDGLSALQNGLRANWGFRAGDDSLSLRFYEKSNQPYCDVAIKDDDESSITLSLKIEDGAVQAFHHGLKEMCLMENGVPVCHNQEHPSKFEMTNFHFYDNDLYEALVTMKSPFIDMKEKMVFQFYSKLKEKWHDAVTKREAFQLESLDSQEEFFVLPARSGFIVYGDFYGDIEDTHYRIHAKGEVESKE